MQKVIKVEVKDLEKTLKFNVRLFDAMTGLDFLDKRVSEKSRSVKSCLGDLLPLATLLSEDGTPIEQMSLEKVSNYFESPLAPLELGMKIFEHQTVFMKSSAVFRPYGELLEKMFRLQTSEKVISSIISSLEKSA